MKNLFIYNIFLTSFCFSLSLEHSDIYDNSWALVVGINKYENVEYYEQTEELRTSASSP